MRTLLPFALLALFSSSCDLAEPCDDCDAETSAPVCTSTYQGPTSGSVAGTCERIFEQRCQNGNTAGANDNCQYALSTEDAAKCPYCARRPSSNPSTGGGSGSGTTCNTSGVAFGCFDSAPYTCPDSSSCFGSYSECVSSPSCT
ncbi:hypothetical protein ACLESO_52775 [Pyxidicoccus sp. 3LG]